MVAGLFSYCNNINTHLQSYFVEDEYEERGIIMIVYKDMLRKLMFFLLFIILMIVVTTIFQLVQNYFEMQSHYDRPMGDAVKVFQTSADYGESMAEQYIKFLLYGP